MKKRTVITHEKNAPVITHCRACKEEVSGVQCTNCGKFIPKRKIK